MELLRFLEGIRFPFLDSVFSLITSLGEETIAVVILCAIFWCINKRIAYGIGIAYFLSGLTVQGMKICFRIERPWVIDPTLNPTPSAIEAATGYSFPSGHTQSAVALYGTLGAQIKRKYIKVICFIIVFLVAFSRLYLGVHTLQDVSVSLVLTALLVFLTIKLTADRSGDKRQTLILCVFMLVYAIAVTVVAFFLFSAGKVEHEYLSDCLKAAGAGIGFVVGIYIERVYIDFPEEMKSLLLQFVKLILGIAGVLVIKEGMKLVIGTALITDTVRYFLMLIWVTALYPLIIKRIAPRVDRSEKN